ncbi:MAG: transglycosylase SLT domain-containing protein [Candidatus Aenigmatarchaeota archaeon]
MAKNGFTKKLKKYAALTSLAAGLVIFEPAFERHYIPTDCSLNERVEQGIETIEEYVRSLPKHAQERIESQVKKYLQNGYVESVWKNISNFVGVFEREAKEEGINPKILLAKAIVEAEHPKQVSSKGAAGQFQFTKQTAMEYGIKMDRYIDERFDPERSSDAAARELRRLIDRFENFEIALMAYNWGEGKARRKASKSFWDMQIGEIPKETYYHIPKVIAVAKMLEKPERYGLNLEKNEPEFMYYTTKNGDTLLKISKKIGRDFREIEELNPQIKNPNKIPAGIKIRYKS